MYTEELSAVERSCRLTKLLADANLKLEIVEQQAETRRLQSELAALRDYMAEHAPMELRAFDTLDNVEPK